MSPLRKVPITRVNTVDQFYKSQRWERLDVDDIPPGKQGKFDRVYARYNADGDLIDLHVIEAKGGNGQLGYRTTRNDLIVQQGTVEHGMI